MKKRGLAFCLILLLCLMPASVSFAAEENYDTLANWNLRIHVPDGTVAVLEGSEYYIYAQRAGEIPYVMVRTYRYDDAIALIDDFTAYMQKQYADLTVTADATKKTIGDKSCYEIDYSYTVSGYDVRDRRIVIVADGMAYMFASKEIDSLDRTIGSMLDDVVANCTFLSGTEDNAEPESGLADGYLYSLANGMPKYWLDFTGTVEDNLVLHCYFRSSDPTFYESCFILDLSTAAVTENGLEIVRVYDRHHLDHSDWFSNLTLQFYLDGAVMTVERDEKTLAGGAEDNILTGTYLMKPVGVSIDKEEKRTSLRPAEDGPYQAEELGDWARIFYFRNTGFFPPETSVTENPDGSFTIHLYETVNQDGITHTATSAWYTVDAYGDGKNDITGETVSIMR